MAILVNNSVTTTNKHPLILLAMILSSASRHVKDLTPVIIPADTNALNAQKPSSHVKILSKSSTKSANILTQSIAMISLKKMKSFMSASNNVI